MTQYIKKLPAVFQTVTEKKFFDATFDQVFSKKDSDLLFGYLGRRYPGTYNPISDFYLPEPTKDRTWWQLEATAYARNEDTTRSNVFFYDDLLERIQYYGGNTENQDRLFSSEYYSFGPPIDYDMFINYQSYYWVPQGLPVITIYGVTDVETEVINQPSYTTPPGSVPLMPNGELTLSTGMTVIFADAINATYRTPHVVENFGGCIGIQLLQQYSDFTAGSVYEFLPWDGSITLSTGRVIEDLYWDDAPWEIQQQPSTGDYITIERGAVDQNAWSRSNKWFSLGTISDTITATGTAFPSNAIRGLRPIIQFIADIPLYKSGTVFRSEINYGFRDLSESNPIMLSQVQGQTLLYINNLLDISLNNGDLVCFFNENVGIKDYIYQANIVAGVVTFTQSGAIILSNEIVRATDAGPYNSAQPGQTWYYHDNVWQQAYNDKTGMNQPPLFALVDHDDVPLDSSVKYPSSSFTGSKIFSYQLNDEPGATIDPVLGFPIVYSGLGQATDIMFQNDLITDRYTYGANLPISGYYYYKTTGSDVLYNNWNLYQPCPACFDHPITPPPPCNCLSVSKQRVIDRFVIGYGAGTELKLSVVPYGYVFGGGAVQSLADIIVIVNGLEVESYEFNSVTGYKFVEINGSVYVDLSAYLETVLSTNPSVPPVVEIQTYTQGLLDPLEPGYFEIPQQLEANPNQGEITTISGSNLIPQFSSIIANQVGATGDPFGGNNNYRDTRKNRSLGSFILQNVNPLLKTMLVSSSDDLDFIIGERFSQDEYTKFKNRYIRTAEQMINQGFNPVQYKNDTVVISYWVDQILKTVNVSKEFSNAFAYSYMIASGTPYSNTSKTVPLDGNLILTSADNIVDINDLTNAMYIYDTTDGEKLLVIGYDYEVISTNNEIEVQLVLDRVPAGNSLVFAFYKNPLPAYIPSTPTKVGAYGAYLPRIELDTSYAIPAWVVIGHDGSKTIAYGNVDPLTLKSSDYRDHLLLELEKRIYNLLQYKYRHQYYLPVRLESVKPGFYRNTRYSRQEYLDITESYLNKWSTKNRANYRTNDWVNASEATPVNSLWKLYNYTDAISANTGQPLNLPGNWKGIFQYYYDTIYPDTRPWEMFGFSEKPDWWEVEYGAPLINSAGQEVWGLNAAGVNNLYADIEMGIIRRGPCAIYNPDTLTPIPQAMWARPGIIIPVDAAGEIIPVPELFQVEMTSNPYEPFDGFDKDWVYGDGGPVEQAWMSTSAYPFSIQEFLYLMNPAKYGEYMWDTYGTDLSPGKLIAVGTDPVMSDTNWQFVQNDVYTSADPLFQWMRPKNADQQVHAENIDGIIQLRFGYQRWISDRILFLGKDITSTFGQKVRTLDVSLANKLAGFTNKDTTTTYIESVTPGVATSGLLIPTNNFDVLLHKSPAVETYSYSGVIIRALADGRFAVYGYDLLSSEFTVFDRSNSKLIDVSVGGTPAGFQYYTTGATYNPGDIVRYNGVYYESLTTQTVQKFIAANWKKLKSLPVVGGISVTYKPDSLATTTTIPYGSILNGAQEVFDMLIGWGAYLTSKGWQFTEVNQDTNQVSDWLYSAKQFLFWLNTDWAPDASIQLSPLANTATLVVSRGYPDDVETLTNGVYSILDKYGVAIPPTATVTEREGRQISVSPIDVATGGIYYLQVNTSETEHVLIFDNTTSFNDIIYSPLLRARQQRLRFNGFRSNGWYGKMEAPGYLVIDNQLVPNFDTIVESMRYFYDPNTTVDNPSIEELGRHLIGYESKSYLDNLQVSNDVQYLFYQGAIRQKGTTQAFEKLFRSTYIQNEEIIKVYEEWALKLGQFGNTVEQVSTEFKLQPEQNTGEVIVARLNYVPSTIGFVKQINILNAQNVYTVVPEIVISDPDAPADDPALTEPPRRAKAYAVLNSSGVISRIDITDPGYGYLSAPTVTVSSTTEDTSLDSLYSVWQGEILLDETINNIIDIDIDDTDVWTVRPTDAAYSLEFPVTDRIEYPIPNAGYVNFNDVDLYSFSPVTTAVNWGTTNFNPVEGNTIWVAKTFTDDWNVYKLVKRSDWFDVIETADGSLQLITYKTDTIITTQFTDYGDTTDFGNLISLQVIEAQLTVSEIGSDGTIVAFDITKEGANYVSAPTVDSSTGSGSGVDVEVTVAGGVVSNYTLIEGGTGYNVGDIIYFTPPQTISGAENYALGIQFNTVDSDNSTTYYYYDIITLDGNPVTATDVPDYANFTKLMLFKTMRFYESPVLATYPYIADDDKIWVDNVNNLWQVLIKDGTDLVLYREQEKLINTSLFQSASVFSTGTDNLLVQLPVYDPFKNILPGPAKQNITYMSMQDPARYNVTGDNRLFSENVNFTSAQVGQLWWDLSSTRFVYYEQPKAVDETESNNLVYRRDHWGQIFPGSTVAIYEWTESDVPPDQYTGTGTPRSLTTYVQLATSNRFTSSTTVKYYFWVLNATDKPNIENRTLAALDVSRLLQSPKSQNFAFFAPIQQTPKNNSYMFYNIQQILAYRGNNVQIQYRLGERDDQEHTQWAFFREGDSNCLVTDQFWNKMVDSLCAYTAVLPASDEYTGIPIDGGEILPVPDPTLSSGEKYGIEYRPRQGMFVNLQAARKVFVQAANSLLQYIPIRDDNPAWDDNVTTDTYWEYTNWYAPGFENVTPDIVFQTAAEANAALNIPDSPIKKGDIVQVTNGTINGRFVLYEAVQVSASLDLLSLEEVATENSAIKLLDTVYTTSNVYGLSVELRQLLNAFRTEVMVKDYLVDQNELFFAMMNYVMSEQKNPNWLFKTSYIYVKEDNLPLSQTTLYVPDQIGNVVDFIKDSKPYHTQIRDYTSSYLTSDIAAGTATDEYLINTIIQFGYSDPALVEPYIDYGTWDTSSGVPEVWPDNWWDSNGADGTTPWDVATEEQYIVSGGLFPQNIDQFIARNDVYTVPLSFYDVSKVGYSQLYPYTFTFDDINVDNPQTFITPSNIVAVQVGQELLISGQDYYAERNDDNTYTVYFFEDPVDYGVTPIALVFINGGDLMQISFPTYRNELAMGYPVDDLVVNVDTLLPVNDLSGVSLVDPVTETPIVLTTPIAPYVGYGERWDVMVDTIASDIIIAEGGTDYIPWDTLVPDTLPNTISYKQNVSMSFEETIIRNADAYSAELAEDIPAPIVPNENTTYIVVYDPLGILPDPTNRAVAIWIDGERFEYRIKEATDTADTWKLSEVARGTMNTAPTAHSAEVPEVSPNAGVGGNTVLVNPPVLVPNKVWIETDNALSQSSNLDIWNLIEPGVEDAPAGGLWYAQTPDAIFLQQQQGKSIP